ncbi:MAG: co-chaperone DjlA [Cocleimonas sp.]
MKLIKYIVAILFYYLFGHSFFWAFIGLLVGGYLNFKLSGGLVGKLSGFGNVGGFMGGLGGIKTEKQSVFFNTAFSLMGTLAKADGRVSEQEITHVEKFMTQLNMSAAHRKQAINHFKEGAKPDFKIEPLLQQFSQLTATSPNLKQMLMVYLVRVALADGTLAPEETTLLKNIATQLGYSDQAFEQFMAMLQGQDQFSGGAYHQGGSAGMGGYTSASAISSAYQALGITKDNTDAEIKKAYRRLVREYHPDKLMGQGLPEAMIKEATERSQEIQTAYDLIKKSRGMK